MAMDGKMVEAVLFDIGDTLIQFDMSEPRRLVGAAVGPVHQWLIDNGHKPPAFSRYEKTVWRRVVRAFAWSRLRRREVDLLATIGAVHRRFGITLPADRLATVMAGCAPALRGFLKVDPQAVGVVQAIHEAGFALGIVSNVFFPAQAVDGVLRAAGLLDFFPTRIYSSDVGYRKPHPEIFRIASRKLSVAAARSIYVGDQLGNDVRGASRVGMRTVWLAAGGGVLTGRDKPDHVIQELTELLPILQVNDGYARRPST